MHDLDPCPFTRRGFLITTGRGRTTAATNGVGPRCPAGAIPRHRLIREGNGQTTYQLAFDTSIEVLSGLLQFARKHHLVGGSLTGQGSVKDASLAYFERKKGYRPGPVDEHAEVLSLTGNLALRD